ncbi:ATP-binding cassette domain-containing protein [Nostoc sp. CHAB 5834]|nr:ATP-binding cassette domain-containing protein [Nostoc sp. CHAB 5834]
MENLLKINNSLKYAASDSPEVLPAGRKRPYQRQNGQCWHFICGGGTLNWSDIASTDWRNWVGCMPQPIKIFNGTLMDNICLGNAIEEGEAVVQFCQAYGFHDYFMKLPQNYLTLVGEEGINLSGGQQQLVGLARTLFRRPQLLLVDEATSALDRHTEQFVVNLFERIKPGTAISMVTHRSQSVQLADRVYAMENGMLQLTSNTATVA